MCIKESLRPDKHPCFPSSKFIQDKFSSYSQKEAVYTVGAIYDVALLFTAVVGIIIVSTYICMKQYKLRRWLVTPGAVFISG